MKASIKKTLQPSLALHSAALEAQGQGAYQYIGTGPRLSVLRRDCLICDRHRCVISRVFDLAEADERFDTPGGARDDDGNLLADELYDPAYLEVAHILLHSLTQVNREGKLVSLLYLREPSLTKLSFRILLKNLHLRYLICSILVLRNLSKAQKSTVHVMLLLLLFSIIYRLVVSRFTSNMLLPPITLIQLKHFIGRTMSGKHNFL